MIHYEPIAKEDIDMIADLTAEHLTHGDYVLNEIRTSAKTENYYGVKAMEDGKLVGYLTFKRGIEFTLPHPELTEEIVQISSGEYVFTGDAISVDSNFRRRGVARELTLRARDQMLALGGRYFLGELWVHPDGSVPARTPTEYYGETVFEEYVPFFYRDLPRYGMCCPICGEDCRCGALMRLVRLKGDT